jgi:hypothetical protein
LLPEKRIGLAVVEQVRYKQLQVVKGFAFKTFWFPFVFHDVSG